MAAASLTKCSNCTFTSNSAVGNGGGAYYAALQNCSVVGNKSGNNGGGVYGTINNCILTGNISSNNGGGTYVYYNTVGLPPTFSNSVFTLNVASNGGGAYGAGILSNCIFLSNSVTGSGGGIYGGTAANCSFTNNSAFYGGGVSGGTATNCSMINNLATYGGGGYSETIQNCRLIGNSASMDGGGIYNTFFTTIVTNSLIENNSATNNGGGIYGGTVGKCILASNWAGASGGGAYNSPQILYCIVSNNTARVNGGGTFGATVANSLLTGNSAASGGGAYSGSLNNSTVVNNSATSAGGGAYNGPGTSSILYYNYAPVGQNYSEAGYSYCCLTPLPSVGTSNITADPGLVNFSGGNFRLQTNSPCIGTGTDRGVVGFGPVDLDGRPRVINGRIDIGAYEFQGPGIGEFIAWLKGYGLPTDGSADFIDSDSDGMNNWQEWVCGTDPTNPLSVLKMLAPSNNVTGVSVNWQSVANRTYFLQSSTNLETQPAFSTIQSNISGQAGTTEFMDSNAKSSGPHFYRVGVQ